METSVSQSIQLCFSQSQCTTDIIVQSYIDIVYTVLDITGLCFLDTSIRNTKAYGLECSQTSGVYLKRQMVTFSIFCDLFMCSPLCKHSLSGKKQSGKSFSYSDNFLSVPPLFSQVPLKMGQKNICWSKKLGRIQRNS